MILTDLNATFVEYLNLIPFEESPIDSEKLYRGQNQNTHIKIIDSKNTAVAIYELFAGKLQNVSPFSDDADKKTKMQKLYQKHIKNCQIIDNLIEKLTETEEGYYKSIEKVSIFIKKAMNLMIQSLDQDVGWFDKEINHFRLLLQVTFSNTHVGSIDSFKI